MDRRTAVHRLLLSLVALAVVAAAGCGTRGADVRTSRAPRVEQAGPEIVLDRGDLDRVFVDAQTRLLRSSFFTRAAAVPDRTTLGVVPLANQTSKVVDTELEALLTRLETDLVGRDVFLVVGHGRHAERVAAKDGQPQLDVFDPAVAAAYGRELGVAYLLTGKVLEHVDGAHPQYFVMLRVIEVQTGRVAWTTEGQGQG